MKLPIVIVRWHDAVSEENWTPMKDVVSSKPCEVYTMGYLLVKDEEKVILAHGLSNEEDPMVFSHTVIPADWVQEIKELKIVD